MKKLLLTISFCLSILNVFSQWNINGMNINNTNTGNVGIGTTSPAYKLDVNGNFRTTSFAAIREYLTIDNGGSYRVALNGQSDGYITARNNSGEDKLVITTNGNSYFNGGNVGIGTNNPKTKFQLDGQSGTQNRLRINAPYVGAEGRFDITMGTGDDDLGAGLRAYVPTGQPGIDRIYLGLYTTTYNGGLQSRVERLTIADNGNVGVAVANPQYRLHVAGYGHFQGRLAVQADNPDDNSAAFWNNSNTGYGLYSQGGADGRYAFHFLNKEGNTIMYGKGDGRVGIGTSLPDATLTVKGSIHTQEVKVDLLGAVAPDYVFEPTYELK
ncbi:MAG: hypothetical protein EBU52_06570, partial [Cytophagia bacterium]|nr:hypothetical protein [Cytophagia bacterium]